MSRFRGRGRGGRPGGRPRPRGRPPQGGPNAAVAPGSAVAVAPRQVQLPTSAVSMAELAQLFGVHEAQIIKSLLQRGVMSTRNSQLDPETARAIAEDLNIEIVDGDAPGGVQQRGEQHRRAPDGAGGGGGRPRPPPAGGDDHGPRRPRQDLAAGRHPGGERRRGRGRGDHPAHRRLPGGEGRAHDHLHRYPRPRRLHRHAGPGGPGDGHRRDRRRRRRRGDAPDGRSSSPTPGRPASPSSSPSTRSTAPTPTRTASASSSRSTTSSSPAGAATWRRWRSRPCRSWAWTTCWS